MKPPSSTIVNVWRYDTIIKYLHHTIIPYTLVYDNWFIPRPREPTPPPDQKTKREQNAPEHSRKGGEISTPSSWSTRLPPPRPLSLVSPCCRATACGWASWRGTPPPYKGKPASRGWSACAGESRIFPVCLEKKNKKKTVRSGPVGVDCLYFVGLFSMYCFAIIYQAMYCTR